MIFLVILTCIYSLGIKESYKPKILERRRKRHGIQLQKRTASRWSALKMFIRTTLFRPVMMLVTEPIVTFFSLYVAVDFGILYIFLASFPLVYTEVYKFNLGQVGLSFTPILVGCVLGSCTCLLCDRFFYRKQLLKLRAANGSSNSISDHPVKLHVEPEHRLYPSMIGSLGIPLGLFWFAWTARPDIHWASPMVGTMMFAFGFICVFVSI